MLTAYLFRYMRILSYVIMGGAGLVGAISAFCRLFAYSVAMGDYIKGTVGADSLPTNGEVMWTVAGLMAGVCLIFLTGCLLIRRSE